MIRFDIGQPDGSDDSIPMIVQPLARAILAKIPPEQRNTAMRAIHNAIESLCKTEPDDDIQVVRGDAADLRLSVDVRFKDLEDDDLERIVEVRGRAYRNGFNIIEGLARIDSAPASYASSIRHGEAMRRFIDIDLLDAMVAERATAAGGSIEIHYRSTDDGDTDRFLHHWMVG